RVARSRTPMPGLYLIATRSETCSGETPTSRASRRSSRPTRSKTGRSASARGIVSSSVFGISLTVLTIAAAVYSSVGYCVDRALPGEAVADEDRVRVEAAARELDAEPV